MITLSSSDRINQMNFNHQRNWRLLLLSNWIQVTQADLHCSTRCLYSKRENHNSKILCFQPKKVLVRRVLVLRNKRVQITKNKILQEAVYRWKRRPKSLRRDIQNWIIWLWLRSCKLVLMLYGLSNSVRMVLIALWVATMGYYAYSKLLMEQTLVSLLTFEIFRFSLNTQPGTIPLI
jgi:hypothetical protein